MADFAVIKTGGKQYKVKVGDILKIEKILSKDKTIEFSDILFGKLVTAEIEGEKKNDKIVVVKHHAKKHYNRTQGHRQTMTIIKIKEIK